MVGKTRTKPRKKFIKKAIKKPGALRKALRIKKNKTIPVSKLKQLTQKGSTLQKRRANLALTFRKLRKRKKK